MAMAMTSGRQREWEGKMEGERESGDGEWKRKVASLRLTPMRLFTQFQIPTQFE